MGDLEKLFVRDKYHGGDQVPTTNGSGMEIDQIGRSFVRTPNKDLVLNNVLYVPQASKNLVSVHRLACNNDAFFEFHPSYLLIKDVHRLACDNDAFFEFHPSYLLIKDQTTKKVLHRGRCEGAFIL